MTLKRFYSKPKENFKPKILPKNNNVNNKLSINSNIINNYSKEMDKLGDYYKEINDYDNMKKYYELARKNKSIDAMIKLGIIIFLKI